MSDDMNGFEVGGGCVLRPVGIFILTVVFIVAIILIRRHGGL